MSFSVKISGFKDAEEAMRGLKHTTNRALVRKILKKAGEPIADAARSRVPVRSGRLRESIIVSAQLNKNQKRQRGKLKSSALEIYVGPNTKLGAGGRHGHLVEFGTYKDTAQPFLRPAWEAAHAKAWEIIQRDFAAEVEKAVTRAARRAAKVRGKT